jgi:hypothetical protein
MYKTTFGDLSKLEVQGADFTKKETYRDELFKMLPKVEVIDKMNREGDEIDSTINEDDDDFDEGEDIDDGELDDDDLDEEDEEESGDFDEDEDDEEEEAPKSSKKPRKN